MRNITKWREPIVDRLKPHWPDTTDLSRAYFCNIELGLYLLSQLVPNDPAYTLWVLLTGYPFSTTVTQSWNDAQRRMLGNARHILPYFRSQFQWERALKQYRTIDESLRIYNVDEKLTSFELKPVSIASNRMEEYEKALNNKLPYRKDKVKWASEGIYFFKGENIRSQIKLPPEFIYPAPNNHDLTGKGHHEPITVTWRDLLETAQWMDTQVDGFWYDRLSRVRLELFDQNNVLNPADRLTLDGLTNLIGMVSSGKSTLMDILTVWAVRQGLRVTIVVGDVIGALNRAKLFHQLNLCVAPILGQSNRERHTNRLHRVLATEQPTQSPLEQQHVGFNWLSTACILDGLRDEDNQPFTIGKQPCFKLYSPEDAERSSTKPKYYACPMYAVCPYHQAQRDLVTAKIWIATSASLVYTRVAPQINRETVRFTELVYLCSDLVIIDEADQVQVQLDMTFSPNQTLVSTQEGWLDTLSQRAATELNLKGRGQLVDENVDLWQQANEVAQIAANKIYGLLLRNADLRNWIEQGDYFTDWLLFDKIANELIVGRTEARRNKLENVSLPEPFEKYLIDPLGERNNHPLATLSQQCITLTTVEPIREQIIAWINEQDDFDAVLSDDELANLVVYFQFTLLVAVLQNRINFLVREWKQVEATLKLEGTSSLIFNRPPKDYEAVIPASPMGNLLAFQYIRPSGDSNASGELRFFRCMGIGRWWLLHFHELFAADGIVGPHVLLLSGSSWAGNSPGYHIQTPVAGVLRSPNEEVEAIEQSLFKFDPLYNNEGQPIKVSGKQGRARTFALENILSQLTKIGLSGTSELEQVREELPLARQRILFLVGSYKEAKHAREFLEQFRSDWRDQILNLVPDDETFESDWQGMDNRLQRGLVHGFADTGAWILIAPLLAIERGHNILNEQNQAAIGAAYFLVRPHPRPDDISFAIHSINRWAIEHCADSSLLKNIHHRDLNSLNDLGNTFRDEAYLRWRQLLHLPLMYSVLANYSKDEWQAITWNQLVTIWQVIGRLIRGGSPARVYFCDAAFAYRIASHEEGHDETSLLFGMLEVLSPYFTDDSTITPQEKSLVQALYGPFYEALKNMEINQCITNYEL